MNRKSTIDEFLNSDYKVYKIYSTHPANISYTDIIQISDKQLSTKAIGKLKK